MNLEQVFIFGLTAFGAVLGWLCRQLFEAVNKLRADLESLRVHLADDYVRHDRMERAMERALQPVMKNLERIETAILTKADKT